MPHPGENPYDNCYAYRLTTLEIRKSDATWVVHHTGYIVDAPYTSVNIGLLPVVSLPSNIQVTPTTSNGKTIWTIVQ